MRKIGWINFHWLQCEGCKYWANDYGCTIDAEYLDKYLRLENNEIVCEYEDKNK